MVSEYLESLKTEGNWNFLDLSKKTGLSESTIRRIFKDPDNNPTMDTLVKLVVAMGGSLDKMVGIAGEQGNFLRNDSAPHATFGEMRDMHQDMMDHQRKSYEREIDAIRNENERLIQEKKYLRRSLYAVVSVMIALMFATILFLIYDLTHLDRGWIQTYYGIDSRNFQFDGLLYNIISYLKGVFHV